MKTKKLDNKNAVIYARYSSHRQKDISIEQQVGECEQLAKSLGLRVLRTYADRAISGKTDKRPDFQKMMADAASGEFAFVLAWKSNRIGRNLLECLVNQTTLSDFGVSIKYVEEEFDDTAAGRFAARSMMNVNQFYSENMTEDIIRGMRSNAERCLVTNGHLPLGYKSESGKIVLNPPYDDVVREIFRRAAAGETYASIADDFNRRGLKSSLGRPFTRNSFYTILKNERYRGIYIYDDIRVEGGLPRIVSDDLFFRAKEAMKTARKTKRRRAEGEADYLLTGKLFCGSCGTQMTGMSGKSRHGQIHYYYACHKQRHGACDMKAVRRDGVELAVARTIKEKILQPDVIEWLCDAVEEMQRNERENSEIKIHEDHIKRIDLSLSNIYKAIEDGLRLEHISDRIDELKRERKETEELLFLATVLHEEVSRDEVRDWMNRFVDGDVDDYTFRKTLFDSFVSKVFLFPDRTLKIVLNLHGGVTEEVTLDDLSFDAEPSSGLNNAYLTPPIYERANPSVVFIAGGLAVITAKV